MGIPEEDIARIRDATDIVALINERVSLKRSGARWVGLCPFHVEKSPSFSVNQQQGLYYCFGCGAKGDAITFVREIDHLDFVEAVETLSRRSGVDISFEDPADDDRRKRRAELSRVVADACDWFHQSLMTAPEAGPARRYLRDRGFDRDMVQFYQLGWSPKQTGVLRSVLGCDVETMVAAGLMHPAQDGRPARDVFEARVMFPILSLAGDPIGFGGRVLPDGKGPKYKNSPDGVLYTKSRVLYGLSWAKSEVVAQDRVLVCEGYTDVIAARRAGVTVAVATCGTALTDDHAKLLARFTKNVVLGFDADTAGQQAAARFHQWEHRYGFGVSVLRLPSGADPADVASTDPTRFVQMVHDAVPLLQVRVDQVLNDADLTSPEGRAAATKAAAAVVADHPDPVLRGQYLRDIADRTGTAPNVVVDAARLSDVPGRAGAVPKIEMPASVEFEALQVLAADRDSIIDFLCPDLFSDSLHRAAFTAATSAGSVAAAASSCEDPTVVDLLIRASVEPTSSDPFELAKRLVARAVETHVKALSCVPAPDPRHSQDLLTVVPWTRQMISAMDDPDPQTAAETFVTLLDWVQDGFPVDGGR